MIPLHHGIKQTAAEANLCSQPSLNAPNLSATGVLEHPYNCLKQDKFLYKGASVFLLTYQYFCWKDDSPHTKIFTPKLVLSVKLRIRKCKLFPQALHEFLGGLSFWYYKPLFQPDQLLHKKVSLVINTACSNHIHIHISCPSSLTACDN